jgi:hypothetical protein
MTFHLVPKAYIGMPVLTGLMQNDKKFKFIKI